jgi:hypothetical protein
MALQLAGASKGRVTALGRALDDALQEQRLAFFNTTKRQLPNVFVPEQPRAADASLGEQVAETVVNKLQPVLQSAASRFAALVAEHSAVMTGRVMGLADGAQRPHTALESHIHDEMLSSGTLPDFVTGAAGAYPDLGDTSGDQCAALHRDWCGSLRRQYASSFVDYALPSITSPADKCKDRAARAATHFDVRSAAGAANVRRWKACFELPAGNKLLHARRLLCGFYREHLDGFTGHADSLEVGPPATKPAILSFCGVGLSSFSRVFGLVYVGRRQSDGTGNKQTVKIGVSSTTDPEQRLFSDYYKGLCKVLRAVNTKDHARTLVDAEKRIDGLLAMPRYPPIHKGPERHKGLPIKELEAAMATILVLGVARHSGFNAAYRCRDWLMGMKENDARGWTDETHVVETRLMDAVATICASTRAQMKAYPEEMPDLFLLAATLVENNLHDEMELFAPI